MINILEMSLYDRSLEYVSELIVYPLEKYNHHKFDDYDKKQLADIVRIALEKVKSNESLASDFGHYTNNWNIDWHWISHHITGDYHNIKTAQAMAKPFGVEITVIKVLDKTSSPEAQKLYLTDANNPASEPKQFILSELIKNGSNFGKLQDDWKPVIGLTDFGFYQYHPYGDSKNELETEHYYDNSYIRIKEDWHKWDERERKYKVEPLPEAEAKKLKGLIKIYQISDDGKKRKLL